MLSTGIAAERAVNDRRPRLLQRQVVRTSELQLCVFVRAGDSLAGRPLYREIIDRARDAGLSGATVVRGMQGFGASGKLRPSGLTGRSGSEPVLIEITDDAERVRAFLPVLDRLIGSGLVVLHAVTVTRQVPLAPPNIAATATP
jgi:uncharacterized protein